ncbi:MAG: ABC transporter substrate-binding protein [Solirubrobacteraceae bacterium]|nr:ABC transporter substrate-binding protein [Solirubrobacteraceae bacterium]
MHLSHFRQGLSTHREPLTLRSLRALALVPAAVATLALAACGSESDGASTGASTASAGVTATAPAETQKVSFALDWTPNTNHIGVYVADKLGLYEKAGIELEILPFSESAPITLVGAGKADFGVSTEGSVILARSQGQPVKSVFAITQRETSVIVVDGDNTEISSPKDLDGKTYGGFGVPAATATVRAIIRNDGGTGEFEEATLSTGAYQALKSGKIDFTQSIATWESVEVELAGHPFKAFEYADYGMPRQHTTVIVATDAFLQENPDLAKRFVSATEEGYRYAIEHPEEAAQILLDAAPNELGGNPELVKASMAKLVEGDYLTTEDGAVGVNVDEYWSGYGDWLVEQELVAGESGKPLAESPDWTEYYTNEYLGSAAG